MLYKIVTNATNISPQPFDVTDVTTCDKAKTVDRLYVDEKGFMGNILLDVRSSVFLGNLSLT